MAVDRHDSHDGSESLTGRSNRYSRQGCRHHNYHIEDCDLYGLKSDAFQSDRRGYHYHHYRGHNNHCADHYNSDNADYRNDTNYDNGAYYHDSAHLHHCICHDNRAYHHHDDGNCLYYVYDTYDNDVDGDFHHFPTTSVGTVNVVYWPTDKPYSYPATYFDPIRDYTFTSPSVYMVINTLVGTNSAGRAGPAATNTIWAFDLTEVSTLVLPAQTETRQLTLNDLGTDCPQLLPPAAIATKAPEPRCDPVLAAPLKIRSWAFPCNACGGFGLFDPPYAVPTLTGGLLGTITAVPATTTTVLTSIPAVTPAPTPSTARSTTMPQPTFVTAAAARLSSGTVFFSITLTGFLMLFL